jgi:hypothetical protein
MEGLSSVLSTTYSYSAGCRKTPCFNLWGDMGGSKQRFIAKNWYEIQLFFRILHWFCLISKLSHTQFDGPWRGNDASPTYNSLTINLYFGPPCHLMKFGHGVFLHPVLSVDRDIILSDKSNNYFIQA